jgi:hypothetical protein
MNATLRAVHGSAFVLALLASVALAPGCGTSSSGFQDPDASSGGSSGGSGGSSGGSGGSSGGSGSSSGGLIGDGGGSGDGSLSADAGCATATAKATKSPVYLEFILDGSGSMRQNNKWTAATQALNAVFGTVQAAKDTGEGIGLIVFSDTKDPTHSSGPYPDGSGSHGTAVFSDHLTLRSGCIGSGSCPSA